MAVALNPLVKWAQNRNELFLTVELSDAVINNLDVEEKTLKFQGTKTRANCVILSHV